MLPRSLRAHQMHMRPRKPSPLRTAGSAHLDRFARCIYVALLLGNTSRGERIFRPRCESLPLESEGL
jgi:hypothetical protein